MIVVADSSPLIVLVNIGQSQILPALFATVIIPPQMFLNRIPEKEEIETRKQYGK